MSFAKRSWAVAAGAAALVASQAVYAAPARNAGAVDPLVSLSLLGTAQSRAAVCGTGTACTLPATALRAPATMASPAVAGTAASAAALQSPADRRLGVDWPGLVVLFAFPVILTLIILLEDDGAPRPLSPA